jgi:hypothetical protein
MLSAPGALAEAHPPAEDGPPRAVVVEGSAGLGTPLGYLGGALVLRPASFVALHGGVGLGAQGVQFAAGARGIYAFDRRTTAGLGVAWSTGALAMPDGRDGPWNPIQSQKRPPIWSWSRAHLINFELMVEHDARSVLIRPFLGLGYVLNGADARLANCDCPAARPMSARFVPYFGFAVAFGVL